MDTLLCVAAVTDKWSDLFFGLEPSERFPLLVVAIGCLTGIILGSLGIVSSAIAGAQRRRAEMDLKREMIDRGMSADEIAKIIEAATPPEDATQRWIASWARPKRG